MRLKQLIKRLVDFYKAQDKFFFWMTMFLAFCILAQIVWCLKTGIFKEIIVVLLRTLSWT